ncbi:MAG: alkyl sulfatase C-terminal domain-containing protein, partial [Candidatus Nanopelagicales bacterium]
ALNNLVFAYPDNSEAKNLLADTYDQLAYHAESGPWRNFYLAGATELRNGIRAVSAPSAAQPGMVTSITPDLFLDALAVRLNGSKIADVAGTIHLYVDDDASTLELSNGTLHNSEGALGTADATIRMTRQALDTMLIGGDMAALAASGAVSFDGDATIIGALLTNLDDFEFWFPIVTP